ncbi:MAG: hypothetical protein ACRC33_21215, partial [Gemmataceae bacterium]
GVVRVGGDHQVVQIAIHGRLPYDSDVVTEDAMARKRSQQAPPAEDARPAVTPERFRRLYKLLGELGGGPKSRAHLLKALTIDVRGFYRDLELLRGVGIAVALAERRYALAQDAEEARARLPFPDPRLTLGEARQVAKGRSRTHARFAEQIDGLTG